MANKNYLTYRYFQEQADDDVIIEDLNLVIPSTDLTRITRGLDRTGPHDIYEGKRVALIVEPGMVIDALMAQNARRAQGQAEAA